MYHVWSIFIMGHWVGRVTACTAYEAEQEAYRRYNPLHRRMRVTVHC